MFDKKPRTNEEIEEDWKRYIQIKKSLEREDRDG
jgi:hypothetical protein